MPPKKDDKKEKPKGWNFDFVEGAIVLLLLVGILSNIGPAIIRVFSTANLSELSFYGIQLSSFTNFFRASLPFLKVFGYLLAGAAAVGTFVYTKKGDAIWMQEKARLNPIGPTASRDASPTIEPPNSLKEKWQKIVALSESENQSDWRFAIIEADIILDDLLEKLHLPGDTMGDKLKSVEKSDFTTIEFAWEAHKARNMIAHEGSDFLLNQREVRRIISLYEAVFKEFYLI